MALHAQARQLARHGRIRARRSRVPMSEPPHRRQENPRPRSQRMAGPPKQAPCQGQLAIQNRRRPRQVEETVPSVRMTRATSGGQPGDQQTEWRSHFGFAHRDRAHAFVEGGREITRPTASGNRARTTPTQRAANHRPQLPQPFAADAHHDAGRRRAVPMRDGINLLADVHRPAEPGQYPVLIAASPYPRQIQDLGAPMGFIEAGASDFFVPRGYVHVIANMRGTSGTEGVFGFFDGQERRDMHDLVEWAAKQPWSNGNVGMIGISYFAGTQMEAAVERPPHLKAIMPVAGTYDL